LTNFDTTGTPPFISIVIPVYNEEAILRTAVVDLVDRLSAFPWSYELVLAENGSTDRTVEVAAELSERFDQLGWRHTEEPNYGKALREGILHARGDIVICDEIDLCDTDFYERAVALLRDSSVDFVVGSKVMEGAMDERPLFRHLGTVVINGMLRVTLGFKGTDTHGLKAFRREPVQAIAAWSIATSSHRSSSFERSEPVSASRRSRFGSWRNGPQP
jgi:glycosyltransferase involved in cell wall biosynthesis